MKPSLRYLFLIECGLLSLAMVIGVFGQHLAGR
jgi:hypothetical protein